MMKIRVFVTFSGGFFAAWLALTFARQVPHEDYPRLGKGSLPVSAEATLETATDRPEAVEELPIELALAE